MQETPATQTWNTHGSPGRSAGHDLCPKTEPNHDNDEQLKIIIHKKLLLQQ